MAAKKLPWFRVYTDITNDPKIRRIARVTEQSKAAITGTWIILLGLASESEPRGTLLIADGLRYELADLVDLTGLEAESLEPIIKEFVNADMLEESPQGPWIVKNWDSRQFASDTSRERVRRYREKQNEGSDPDQDPAPQSEKIEGPITEYISVYEKVTGEKATPWPAAYKMVEEFKAAGVTPAIYGEALEGLKAKGYNVTNMLSAKNWALGSKNQTKKTGPKSSLENFRDMYRQSRLKETEVIKNV